MDKKNSFDNVDARGRGSSRREVSERKSDDQSKPGSGNNDAPSGGADAGPAAKNRRKRAGDEGGWMTSASEGTGSRHTKAAVPVEEDDPKEAQMSRYP